MKNFPTGIKDLDREILSKLPDEDVIKSCSVNKYLKEKVCDEGFFERRMKINYPELKYVNKKYKQSYLETIYYILKMKEMGYDYAPTGEIPKHQYFDVKIVYKRVVNFRNSKTGEWEYRQLLTSVINNKDLNLIKYVLKLHDFSDLEQKISLINATIHNVPENLYIIKYFADRGIIEPTVIDAALATARKSGNVEMIKYFEIKI